VSFKLEKLIKVGLIQFESLLADIEENKNKSFKLMDKTVKLGAQIICFPEMFNTGYNLDLLGNEIYNLAVTQNSEYIKEYCQYAKNNNVHIILPLTIKDERENIFNSALMIDNKGKIKGKYDKTHLFLHEKKYYQAGNNFTIFNIDNIKIGILICYDLGFPEAARYLTLKGADIIFVPSAWRIQDYDIWDLNTRQRALENNIFIVGVNRVGKEADLHLFGNSRIIDPNGEIMMEAPRDEETIIVKELDLSKISKYRNYYQYLKARRNDLYGDFK